MSGPSTGVERRVVRSFLESAGVEMVRTGVELGGKSGVVVMAVD
jgi:acyl-CoA reductase-like NAD-dependent aldehyde dehydrogenase